MAAFVRWSPPRSRRREFVTHDLVTTPPSSVIAAEYLELALHGSFLELLSRRLSPSGDGGIIRPRPRRRRVMMRIHTPRQGTSSSPPVAGVGGGEAARHGPREARDAYSSSAAYDNSPRVVERRREALGEGFQYRLDYVLGLLLLLLLTMLWRGLGGHSIELVLLVFIMSSVDHSRFHGDQRHL